MTQLEDKYNEQDANYIKRRQQQIKNVRYMVYAFVIGILLLVFQPLFTQAVDKVRWVGATKKMTSLSSWNPIDNLFKARGEGGLLNEIDQLDSDITSLKNEIVLVESVLAIVKHLDNEQKQNTISLCLNFSQCDGVPSSLMSHTTLLRNYIILDRLQGEKMDFDQKMVLKSIAEFLLRSTWGVSNGELLSINFSPVITIDETLRLYKLPFTLTANFPNKNFLMTFLGNVDTKMNFDLPILYALDNMSYDAMEYEDEQTVTITMWAYYYVGDPKKINQDHAVAEGEEAWDLGVLADLIEGDDWTEPSAPSDDPGTDTQVEEWGSWVLLEDSLEP